jgi:hypothetical protein
MRTGISPQEVAVRSRAGEHARSQPLILPSPDASSAGRLPARSARHILDNPPQEKIASEGKAAKTVRIYTEAVQWFAARLLRETGRTRWEEVRRGPELPAAMRSPPVVMGLVLGQDSSQMPFAEDQHPVGDLCAGGEHEPFRISVAPHRQLHPIRMIGTGLSG